MEKKEQRIKALESVMFAGNDNERALHWAKIYQALFEIDMCNSPLGYQAGFDEYLERHIKQHGTVEEFVERKMKRRISFKN